MKKNILAVGAVLAAVVLSSFTTQKFATVYFVYQANSTTSVSEKAKSNYQFNTVSPGDQPGSTYIAWFIGTAAIATAPTDAEFNAAFNAIDNQYGGTVVGRLSDETNENTSNFEKRSAL